jgi:hypothetical protein
LRPSHTPGKLVPQWGEHQSEADIHAENPVIIGLISMLTGSTNLDDIEPVYRQLWLRGLKILSTGHPSGSSNPVVISLLEQTKE